MSNPLALPDSPRKLKRNVERQERVVSALWSLLRKNQSYERNTSQEGMAEPVSLQAIRETLEEIMEAFGYVVTPID